ncbi:MAG: MarR family transcriptional regulator [Cyclobacteriaceae bacterium]|nr:MarR family transcriptional regulator [Cyclobacteriaceae bacterium]MCH8515077.1 MarR family transcriptional regulator [Cyclobacteriaceae bacterium]
MIDKKVENSIAFAIEDLAKKLSRNNQMLTARMGITAQEWFILLYLAQDPNIPNMRKRGAKTATQITGVFASHIADALNVSRPNITNLISTLMRKNFIEQKEDPQDRRRKHLGLTKKATKLIEEIEPDRLDANQVVLSGFSKEEKEQFIEYLERCYNHLADAESSIFDY